MAQTAILRVFGTALLCVALLSAQADAGLPEDFHGLLYQCGRHPPVQINGFVAIAYEADLTTATTGTAALGKNTVTVHFPTRHAGFKIVKRGDRYFVGSTRCQVDNV